MIREKAMKRVLALSLILFLLVGCKKDEPTQPQTPPLDISGTWVGTGMSSTGRTVSFEINIAHSGTSVDGSGSYRQSGAIVSTSFTVSGTCSESGLFFISFRVPPTIIFEGIATDSKLNGTIKYGGMEEGSSIFVRK